MQPDDKLCYCFHVTQRKVMNYLKRNELKVPSQLAECNGAGTGCGWCIPYLKKCFTLHKEHQGANEKLWLDLTAEDYAHMRAKYIKDGNGKPAPGAQPLPEEE